MMNAVGSAETVWRGFSQLVTNGNVVRAFVERKDYGADIELSDGRRCSLWEYAVAGPVMDAAVNWAKRNGAVHVTVRGWGQFTFLEKVNCARPGTAAKGQEGAALSAVVQLSDL